MTESRKNRPRQYDLEERTAQFGKDIIGFAKMARKNHISAPLINQLVRSATSVGANYAEADDAESRKDFRHKIALCKKEARETKHWLRMLVEAEPDLKVNARPLWQEAKELHLIFVSIVKKVSD